MSTTTYYKLSNSQREILLDEVISSEKNPAVLNTLGFRLFIKEDYSEDAMIFAFNKVIEENDALRLRLKARGKAPLNAKKEYQYISDFVHTVPETVYVKDEAELDAFAESDISKAVIPERETPLYRAYLIRCENGGGIVFLMHHLISDGFSVEIMCRQFEGFYFAYKNGTTYSPKTGSITALFDKEKDYPGSSKEADDMAFWTSEYKAQRHYSIPPGYTARKADSSVSSLTLKEGLYEKVTEFCKDNGVSVPSFVMSAVSAAVKVISGKDNFALYFLLHGRDTFIMKNTVGCMVKTVPVMYSIDGSISFKEKAVLDYQNLLNALSHSKIPFSEHVKKGYFLSVKNGFNFNHNWFLCSAMGIGSLTHDSKIGFKPVKTHKLSNIFYCAVYNIKDISSLQLELTYQKEKYTEDQICEFTRVFEETVTKLLSSPEKRIESIL